MRPTPLRPDSLTADEVNAQGYYTVAHLKTYHASQRPEIDDWFENAVGRRLGVPWQLLVKNGNELVIQTPATEIAVCEALAAGIAETWRSSSIALIRTNPSADPQLRIRCSPHPDDEPVDFLLRGTFCAVLEMLPPNFLAAK